METIINNTSYQIGSTQFNIERIFLGKYKIEDVFKHLVSAQLNNKNNITDFTNNEICDIIISE